MLGFAVLTRFPNHLLQETLLELLLLVLQVHVDGRNTFAVASTNATIIEKAKSTTSTDMFLFLAEVCVT